MVAVYLGRRRGTLDVERGRALLEELSRVPGYMNELLGDADYVRSVAMSLVSASDVLFLGRGYGYPLALEGALKLKEISYAHAEGYAAGEMKHGPIALVDESLPVVVVCPKDRSYDKTLGNVQEIRARDGVVVALATRGDETMHDLAQHILWMPAADELVMPLLTVVPMQLLAYYVAARKGHDVDQPRNLAKVVTVE
jgi:glucosamine--fructose-6-phosphate aminotransferase (isomerizing)